MAKNRYQYKPRNLKELLVEMKDTSELMVDLAYSAMIYDDEDIAEEVMHLEENMDMLDYQIKMGAILSTRRIEEAEQLLGVLEVAAASEYIANAAMEISKCVLMDISIPDRLKVALRNANETIVKVRLNEESEMVGQTLGDLELDVETGMWIIAMRRNSEWIYAPNSETRLRQDDVLIARGHDEGVPIFFTKATNKIYTPRKVIDYNDPAEFDRSIDIIVEMKNMCELSVGLAYSALLFNNKDIAHEVQAIEQHLDEMKYEVQDLVLEAAASADEDEDLTDYKSLLIFSSASEKISNAASDIADPVVREIELHPIIALAVRESDEVIIKVEVADCSPIIGKTLKELRLETETGIHVLAIKRENRWIYSVNGRITIQENDVLIARGSRSGEEALIEMCSCPVNI
ncbi:potassium channel family protein [Methanimicrococcus hongohii]|nr:TrkA C-terminal domain-containing protein [Methanimicrococcus sp. Hf6]